MVLGGNSIIIFFSLLLVMMAFSYFGCSPHDIPIDINDVTRDIDRLLLRNTLEFCKIIKEV